MLLFPRFCIIFNLHIDARNYQLLLAVSQEQKPIALFFMKLTNIQKINTTTKEELYSIVENLKEICIILLSNNITVYTDQNNLPHEYTHHDCDLVLHHGMLISILIPR